MVSATKKIPVGAHYGWQDWLAQRVTAVIMALFSVVIIGFFMLKGSVNYADWKDLFRSPVFRILALLFFLSVEQIASQDNTNTAHSGSAS